LTHDAGLQYGGETFIAASHFARNHSRSIDRTQLTQHGRSTDADPAAPLGGALAFVRLLARLPRVDVRLSDSSAGREIDRYLRARARGLQHNRIAQGVLHLPERPADYLRGRSRQALRTNLHRAEAANLRCDAVLDLEERLDAVVQLGMEDWAAKLDGRPEDPVWIARDGADTNVGLLWATVDSEWAMLRLLVAEFSEARYALHTALVTDLCSRGVRHVFARKGSALLLTPGLQYFQQRLGYQVAHLRLRRRGRRAISRSPSQAELGSEGETPHVASPPNPDAAAEADRDGSLDAAAAEPSDARSKRYSEQRS
jgi:hypothetical protein